MKKRLLCFTMLLTVTISAITFTNNVKAATKWNTSKSVMKEENGIKYSAYLTEDGKESWIYQIKLSKKITKLTLPKEINQAKLTRVGFGEELYGEGHDSYINIFGDTIEPWHGCYGTLSYNDKNKRTIQEIVFPNAVNQIEAASFTGMTKLRELKMPEQITKVPSYAFAKCTVLSKVTFSKNMQSIASSAFLHSNQVKSFSCPKSNKTFAVKKGMLMTKSGKTFAILGILWKVFLVVIIMHFVCITIQFIIAGSVSKKNPLSLIKNQVPGYTTALGTQSSAATIPVNLECAKNDGVSAQIRNFVVPLCANIHMAGSMITITACATAVCLMNQLPISLVTVIPFIMTLGVAMVASPGAPGGSIMTALPFLYMVFGTTAGDTNGPICALMVALYITQDSFGTACNISGDNAIGIVVDSIYKKFILKEDTVEA